MNFPQIKTQIKKRQVQAMQLLGINLTENYRDGQLESSKNVTSEKFPYISTADKLQIIDTGIPAGYQPVSMFAWEKLFVVSDKPSGTGYACYYGGEYCGDIPTLEGPKQYAVINSKLVVWPDKVYFNLYDNEMSARPLTTAPLLATVTNGTVTYRKKVVTE